MSRDSVYLVDIVQAARLAMSYVADKSERQFFSDIQCQDAVIRRLEVIGEAARRISPETRARIAKLPWSEMIGMRNLMIHQYDDVDLRIVWDSVQMALPPVVAAIEKYLHEQGVDVR